MEEMEFDPVPQGREGTGEAYLVRQGQELGRAYQLGTQRAQLSYKREAAKDKAAAKAKSIYDEIDKVSISDAGYGQLEISEELKKFIEDQTEKHKNGTFNQADFRMGYSLIKAKGSAWGATSKIADSMMDKDDYVNAGNAKARLLQIKTDKQADGTFAYTNSRDFMAAVPDIIAENTDAQKRVSDITTKLADQALKIELGNPGKSVTSDIMSNGFETVADPKTGILSFKKDMNGMPILKSVNVDAILRDPTVNRRLAWEIKQNGLADTTAFTDDDRNKYYRARVTEMAIPSIRTDQALTSETKETKASLIAARSRASMAEKRADDAYFVSYVPTMNVRVNDGFVNNRMVDTTEIDPATKQPVKDPKTGKTKKVLERRVAGGAQYMGVDDIVTAQTTPTSGPLPQMTLRGYDMSQNDTSQAFETSMMVDVPMDVESVGVVRIPTRDVQYYVKSERNDPRTGKPVPKIAIAKKGVPLPKGVYEMLTAQQPASDPKTGVRITPNDFEIGILVQGYTSKGTLKGSQTQSEKDKTSGAGSTVSVDRFVKQLLVPATNMGDVLPVLDKMANMGGNANNKAAVDFLVDKYNLRVSEPNRQANRAPL